MAAFVAASATAVLLCGFRYRARHGIDDLFRRGARRALQEAVHDELRVCTHDGARLILVQYGEVAGAHERIRGDLLRGRREDGVVPSDLCRNGAGIVCDLVHKRHTAFHDEDGEPAGLLVVFEIGDQDVCRRRLFRMGKLLAEEFGNLLREVDERSLAEEVPLEFGCEGAFLGERAWVVIRRVARPLEVLRDERLHRARIELELCFREDGDGRLRVEDMQDRVVDIHSGSASLG